LGWATFLAIFSQTHLVTLTSGVKTGRLLQPQKPIHYNLTSIEILQFNNNKLCKVTILRAL
jgi:hypothetical protein